MFDNDEYITPEIDGCVFDTVECYHGCEGCKWGFVVCSGCGNIIEWDHDICLECGKKREKGK